MEIGAGQHRLLRASTEYQIDDRRRAAEIKVFLMPSCVPGHGPLRSRYA